jgi:hypothetical protein
MTDERVTSDEYAELATVLSRKIVELLSSSKQRNMSPPLELHVTDAGDLLILDCSFGEDAKGVNLGPEMALTARFPLKITLTDANGETLEMDVTRKAYLAQ